jgi:hypothetical protein
LFSFLIWFAPRASFLAIFVFARAAVTRGHTKSPPSAPSNRLRRANLRAYCGQSTTPHRSISPGGSLRRPNSRGVRPAVIPDRSSAARTTKCFAPEARESQKTQSLPLRASILHHSDGSRMYSRDVSRRPSVKRLWQNMHSSLFSNDRDRFARSCH